MNRAIVSPSGTHGRTNPVFRMAGAKNLKPTPITIGHPGRFRQGPGGRRIHDCPPYYVPKKLSEPLYPVGNSLGYAIQVAHLMGASEILALGFTLVSGTGYEHGELNPATGKPSRYTDDHVDRVLGWCKFFEKQYPGRVKVGPEWDGPLREVFHT